MLTSVKAILLRMFLNVRSRDWHRKFQDTPSVCISRCSLQVFVEKIATAVCFFKSYPC